MTFRMQLIDRGPGRAPEELRDEESTQKENARGERERERERERSRDAQGKERGDKMAQLERERGCNWPVP